MVQELDVKSRVNKMLDKVKAQRQKFNELLRKPDMKVEVKETEFLTEITESLEIIRVLKRARTTEQKNKLMRYLIIKFDVVIKEKVNSSDVFSEKNKFAERSKLFKKYFIDDWTTKFFI